MKILKNLFLLLIILLISIPAYSSTVMCNTNNTICSVGKYTIKGPNIQVSNGVMCTANNSVCTNGDTLYRAGNATDKNITINKQKNGNVEIVVKSQTEALIMLSDLYNNNCITQYDFNKLKKNLQLIQIDDLENFTKIANLYKNGYITQFEFNKAKNIILKN